MRVKFCQIYLTTRFLFSYVMVSFCLKILGRVYKKKIVVSVRKQNLSVVFLKLIQSSLWKHIYCVCEMSVVREGIGTCDGSRRKDNNSDMVPQKSIPRGRIFAAMGAEPLGQNLQNILSPGLVLHL